MAFLVCVYDEAFVPREQEKVEMGSSRVVTIEVSICDFALFKRADARDSPSPLRVKRRAPERSDAPVN